MGNNLTHRDNPLHTHSRCTYNTITQNSHGAKHIMSLKWYLLSSETTHYPLPAQCSHNPQSLTKYRRSLQHELQARPTWREKRYQSASHSFSVTAKQCRSDAVQKLFAKERKHNLIYVCAFFSAFHNGSPSGKKYLSQRKYILIGKKTKASTFSLFRPERLNMPT